MGKDRIIDALGERELQLPGLVTRALAANDRVKYRLTLLQSARAAADGELDGGDLHEERLASGVEDDDLDRIVGDSTRQPDGRYLIPGASRIARLALDEVDLMLAPLRAASAPQTDELEARLLAVEQALPTDGDLLEARDIARLAGGPEAGRDTLHLVVLDAHRALNELAAGIATESLAGARAYGLSEVDRDLVNSFMRGIHSTEALKFDHPGLGTLATRAGATLLIQNDLGTTDAHIVVVKVTGLAVSIIYTDVHLSRLIFFQDLVAPWPLDWEDTRSRSDTGIEDGLFHLATGRFEAADEAQLGEFLEHLGSRLVFIIDWNRARKRLRRLVGRRSAIELLRWAAANGYGHMAFLRAGADGLVYEALEFAGGRAVRAGESLEDVLGAGSAVAYLRAVLRICAQGLLANRTLSLVQDEVRAELTGYLRSARQEIHELVLRHAELSVEIAETARDCLAQALLGDRERCAKLAGLARAAEHAADALVTEARAAVARTPEQHPLLALLEAGDDIADCAEEAAFYAALLPAGQPSADARPQVTAMARLVLTAARAYLRAAQLSVELRRGGPREDMDAFLEALHEAIELEHATDDTQRAVHEALVADADQTAVALFAVVQLTEAFEQTSDAIMHSAHLLREHTLARVVRSESAARRAGESSASPSRATSPAAADHLHVIGDASVPVPDATEIGAKAHGLERLVRAGLRVPEAVVLKAGVTRLTALPDADQRLRELLSGAIVRLSEQTGLRFGSARSPLLLSVRSGAPVSMPGMLETVLNVGMCDTAVRGLIAVTGNPRMAWDSYRRFVESFATVVHGAPHEPFARAVSRQLAASGATSTRELTTRAMIDLTRGHLDQFLELTGSPLSQEPFEQLVAASKAVIASWDSPKASGYRRMHDISEDLGTAVIVQRMVFGNAGGISGAGVGFTRDPALGGPGLYMDFLFDAQGEDIVAGRQTVQGIDELTHRAPDVLDEVRRICAVLEGEFGDAQEFELTVEEGTPFLLQTRTAKRTPWATLRIATDQVHEGAISPRTALSRIEGLDLAGLRRRRVDASNGATTLARAIPASVGVATGPLALDREAAERIAAGGTPPVLVRAETVTEDIASAAVCAGVLTGSGGRTSHAAVVARELGKPCLVGCTDLQLDLTSRTVRIGGQTLAEGDTICLDAESGRVFRGSPPIIEERPRAALDEVARWRSELSEADGATAK